MGYRELQLSFSLNTRRLNVIDSHIPFSLLVSYLIKSLVSAVVIYVIAILSEQNLAYIEETEGLDSFQI